MYTIIDIEDASRGDNIRVLGVMTRDQALQYATENGGREVTEGEEKGIIRLDEEGWLLAVPHDLPVWIRT